MTAENRVAKAQVLADLQGLMRKMESKVRLLDALDRDETVLDCMDLVDQVATMTHSLSRLQGAMDRAVAVVGVDAELTALFKE